MPGPYTSRQHDLSTSLSSLDSRPSSRHSSSSIAKSYRQAAQLFLTRRLPEALSTIEPVITPPSASEHQIDGDADGDTSAAPAQAPIATASRGTRVKVWSFYLTFLNAVVELGPEEGKAAFGASRWKQLVAKARDGGVWEDVVRDGYAGVEGDVDAEVVVNLATLLLTHAPTQHLTQTRLESYLSATAAPSFSNIESHLSRPPMARRSSSHNNGTSTPRDLHTRLKLLELYTLHVLPRNEQWDYAAQFISMSEVLDEERREAFLLALQGLREEREGVAQREAELRERQEQERREAEASAEARRIEEERAAEEEEEGRRKRKRDEEARRRAEEQQQAGNGSSKGSRDPPKRNTPATENGHSRTPSTPSSTHSSRRSRPPAKKSMSPPPGLYKRASSLLANMQTTILATAQAVSRNPMAWLRAMLFLAAFLLAFGRAEVRERVRRVLEKVWGKVRGTVGMGVRVSYI